MGGVLKRAMRAPIAMVLALTVLALLAAGWSRGWNGLWASPDQRGRWLFERGHFAEAAEAFRNSAWRGAALMRAGDFKQAEQVFGGLDTALSAYDQGNALVMLGQYEAAVARYDRALALRPDWSEAAANRTIARIRAQRMQATGGDLGDQREGADQIVYDKNKPNEGSQDTQAEGAAMSDEQVRALWLKSVQTKPADFLRARFSYQAERQAAATEPAPVPPPPPSGSGEAR